MKIAVTGSRGRLGRELVRFHGCIPLDVDVTNKEELERAILAQSPDVIIHCAAITDVDYCERDAVKAFRVNALAVSMLRSLFSGKLIFLSTDFVFDGKRGPYSEKDRPNPLNWYGIFKLAAESSLEKSKNNLVVRTTWLFGSPVKMDFVRMVYQNLSDNLPVDAFNNLYGNPTYVPHLAKALMYLTHLDFSGTVHVCGTDWMNCYDEALKVADYFGLDSSLIHSKPYDYKSRGTAPRPKTVGMKTDLAKSLGVPLFSFQDGLQEMAGAFRWK